jgi:hypothetical protein
LTLDAVRVVWESSEFRRVPVASPGTTDLLDACEALFGRENARFAVFEVTGPAAAAPELVDADEYGQYSFAEALLRSRGFARSLPEVVGARALRSPGFVHLDPLLLDGRLAQILRDGTPRARFDGSGARAKALGLGFCAAVLGNRVDEVRVEHSTLAWSSWFKGVAWDHTFVVVDVRHRLLTALCLTADDLRAP